MKQALINLLNNALHPFGLQVEPLRKPLIDPGTSERCQAMLDLYQRRTTVGNAHRAELAIQERILQTQLADATARASAKTTLPPRRRRRGRRPMVELLTMPQVKMVRDKRLSTYRLAKKLGVAWVTANKLRDELA